MTTSVKAQIVQWARWGVEHTNNIHYEETRPMPLTSALPLTTDCSGFVTLCYYLAGAPDPNHQGYDGEGYTGTLLQYGQQITVEQAEPGDVIVYGPDTGWHTALIVEAGADPLTVSHGQESDPSYVRVSQDGRQPQRYLRFPTNSRFPDPLPARVMPTPQGKPTPAQLAVAKLVRVRGANRALAVADGFHLWYWAGDHFVAQIGTEPRASSVYVSEKFKAKP